jgi:hypothetical protein
VHQAAIAAALTFEQQVGARAPVIAATRRLSTRSAIRRRRAPPKISEWMPMIAAAR